MSRLLLPIFLLAPLPAQAHVGHIGELAGHAHWIAVAAGLAAVAVAGALAASKEGSAEDEDTETEEEATA